MTSGGTALTRNAQRRVRAARTAARTVAGGQSVGTNVNRAAASAPNIRCTTFKGNTVGMNGHVFECYEEQNDPNQYKNTVEALDAFVKATMHFSKDLAPLFATKRSAPSVASRCCSRKMSRPT